MRLSAWLPFAAALAASAVSSAAAPARDPHSAAEPERVTVTDLRLDLDADFERRTLAGFAELTLDWKDAAADRLVLDTRALAVERVEAVDDAGRWSRARHALGPSHPVRGQALTIRARGQPTRVRIHYRTSPEASGLQWLAPAQTLGKRLPFMFSQSQAIHARSWVPLQDTPAVRFTYRARIRTPEGLRAVMSADNDPTADGRGGWWFHMPQPIPSYLMAIAIGELAFQPMGERSGVWAEPGRLAAAAAEFADTEAMIVATEALYGPYRWGRYDLLILPPSFPFGGMENPRLSFITPTVIAGDRSLVALIAHELAHSWSGNLVTNREWSQLWLNEGFTSYVENRIVEAVFGAERAAMERVVEEHVLLEELKTLAPGDQWLVPRYDGDRDPDDVFSQVPYTKGAWMLRMIERRVGREAFDAFLRSWFDRYAFRSVDTADFLAIYRELLLAKHPEAMPIAELEGWLYGPGVPKSALLSHSPRFDAVDAVRADWLAGKRAAGELGAGAWTTTEWLHFLDRLPNDLGADRLGELDAAWKLSATGNGEIALRWFAAGIRAGYAAIREPLERHLIEVGRRKLMVPLWEALAARPADKPWALAVYARARPGYHPIAQRSVDAILGVTPR